MISCFLLLSAVAALAHFEMLDDYLVKLHLNDTHKPHALSAVFGRVLKSDADTQTYDVQVQKGVESKTLFGLNRNEFEVSSLSKAMLWLGTILGTPIWLPRQLYKKYTERTT